MTSKTTALFVQYREQGIIVDTNILLLYVVGVTNRQRIQKFKRTCQFLPEDFDLLKQILAYFKMVITTPSILTEVNSLANQLGEPERSRCLSRLKVLMSRLEEKYQRSATIAEDQYFQRFGLTDCGILSLANARYLVLTDDLRLTNHLNSYGIDAVNFNNLRELNWK
ncbi:MAG: PIN domain-containing protein [Cyanobacteria bacterium P01_F01_bin.42]